MVTNKEIANLFDKKRITNPWYIFDNTTDQDDESDCENENKQLFFHIKMVQKLFSQPQRI